MATKKKAYRDPTLDDLIAGGYVYTPLGTEEAPAAQPETSSMARRVFGDTGIAALKGAIGVPEAAVGMADLVTGGQAGKIAESAGFRPKEAKEYLDTFLSPEQQRANAAVQQAEGFMGKMGAAVTNPSVIWQSAVESAPSMMGGATVARGLMKVAPAVSPIVAAGVGEGAVSAGSAAEQVRQQTKDGTLTPEQALLAGGSGALTAGIGMVAAKVAKTMGIGDIDTLLTGVRQATPNVQKGVVRRILEGAVSEGVLEELPQSVQEQVAQNLALGKPLSEGVDHAAVLGMLTGAAMGAAVGPIGMQTPQSRAIRDEKLPEVGPLTKAVNAATEHRAQQVEAGMPTVTADDAVVDAKNRAAELDQKEAGGEATEVQTPGGETVVIPGAPPQQLTPAEDKERTFLTENQTNPEALARATGATIVPNVGTNAPELGTPPAADTAPVSPPANTPRPNTGPRAVAPPAPTDPAALDQRMADKPAAPAVGPPMPGDIMGKVGPFRGMDAARRALANAGPDHELVRVQGGLVVRKKATYAPRPDVPGTAGMAAPADAGRSDQPTGSGAVVGRVAADTAADVAPAAAAPAPGTGEAGVVEPGRQPDAALNIAGQKIDDEWTAFTPESGTKAIPRADMPQIKAEHRGALTQYMLGKGIEHMQSEVPAADLKPTQREFSPAKVDKAREFVGEDRAILVSNDGYVLDGHHQWMAKRDAGAPIRVIVFKAPIDQLIQQAKEFPSALQADGATTAVSEKPAQISDTSAVANPRQEPATAEETQQAKAPPAAQAPEAATPGTETPTATTPDAAAPTKQPKKRFEQRAAKAEQKRDALTIARTIAKAEPDGEVLTLREKARKAIAAELGEAEAHDVGRAHGLSGDDLTQAIHDGQYEALRDFAASMPVPVHESDIPMDMAVRAYSGTSHVPERRAASAQRDYVRSMVDAWKRARAAAGDDAAALDRVTEQMKELVDGYRQRYRASLSAHANVVSSMIVGPAKFPTRANQKRSATADRRAMEAQEYLQNSIKRMLKAARAPVDGSPESELDRVRKNLADREKLQQTMKAANEAVRKGDDDALRALGFSDARIDTLKKPDFAGRKGFADYQLKNNGAEIRRLRERLAQAEQRQEAATEGPVEREVAGVRVVEDATADRLQLFFDGKPDEATRDALKAAGFRWAPSVGAWQRQLTDNARRAASEVLAKIAPAQATTEDTERPAAFRDTTQPTDRTPQLTAIAEALNQKWANMPAVVVVDSLQDPKVPEAVRTELASQDANEPTQGTTRGVYADNTVYLVAPEIKDARQALTVIFHEVLGHHGLRHVFGEKLNPILDRLAQLNPQLVRAKALQYGLAKMVGGEVQYGRMVNGVFRSSDQDVIDAKRTAAEEVLAEMAQTRPNLGWVKRAIAAIRTWLRKMGFDLKFSDDELIRSFILPARAWVERGGKADAQATAPAFSRTDTDAFRRWFGDSKVVDAQGKPLVVYHGTTGDFSTFEPETGWFTAAPTEAGIFAGRNEGANVMPAYVRIERPRMIDGDKTPNWRSAIYDALTDRQIDGVIVTLNGKPQWVVPAGPNQIKSATGNRGTFDPSSADVRFSRIGDTIDTLKSAEPGKLSAQDLLTTKGGVFDFNRLGETQQDKIRTVVDGSRPFWLGALTRDQIADIYGKQIPQVREYDKLTRAMENERSKRAQDAEAIYNRWAALSAQENARLARIMADATLYSVHPDAEFNVGVGEESEADRKAVHQRISTEFGKLSDAGKAVYREVREHHENTLDALMTALEQRIERQVEAGAARQAAITDIRARFDKYRQDGPYFPLSRFGNFIVVATREDGQRVVAAYETPGEQQAAARALEKDGFTVKMKAAKAYSRSDDGSAGKFIGDVLEKIDSLDMEDVTLADEKQGLKDRLLDDINQLFITSLPDLSFRKHFKHRMGTPGFSSDMMRGFASSAFHAASHIARLNHADKMTIALRDAYAAVENAKEGDHNVASQVVNELTKRHEAALNPNTHPIASMLNSLGFVMNLGLSPAAGFVNMLQVPMVTMPYLGAKYGFGKASRAIQKAYADIFHAPWNRTSGFNAAESLRLTQQERQAISELQNEGVIDLTQAHDLASATGLDTGNVARSKAAFATARAMKVVGWTFHIPEVLNRQVTALTAYRMATARGATHDAAMDAARDAIKRTQFDYSTSNRARFMQGNVARVVLQFKQYAQNMTYFMGRAAHQMLNGETAEVRQIARRQLVATLATTFAMAGALGLPGLGTLGGLIGILASALSDDDEPWDWKVEFRNLMADTFGKEIGEVISHGVPRALMPWDLSARVGMGDLWFRSNDRQGQSPREAFASDLSNILGPTAGALLGWYTAGDHMARGNYAKAAEAITPKAIRDIIKAGREAKQGVTSYTGEPLMDVTVAESLGQLLGFAPARRSEMYEARGAVMNAKTAIDEKRKALLTQAAKARIDQDSDTINSTRKKIAEWNKRNPSARITPGHIQQSVRQRKTRAENTVGGITLPRNRANLRDVGRFAVETAEE